MPAYNKRFYKNGVYARLHFCGIMEVYRSSEPLRIPAHTARHAKPPHCETMQYVLKRIY